MGLKNRISQLRQWVKPDPAVALCLASLRQCDPLFGDEWMWPEVSEGIKRTLMQRSAARSRYVTDEDRAARVVLTLIADVASMWATGGEYHVYRGILNQQGQSLRDIAEIAIHQLHDADWIDYDERDDRLAALASRIAITG